VSDDSKIRAMVDLSDEFEDIGMDKAEMVMRNGSQEFVRFYWNDGTMVELPIRAVGLAFTVACRQSMSLPTRWFVG